MLNQASVHYIGFLFKMQNWIIVANKILDSGDELMLLDVATPMKQTSFWRKSLKFAFIGVYYGYRFFG